MKNKIKILSLVIAFGVFLMVGNAHALEVVDPTPAAAIEYDDAVNVNSSLSATLPSYFFQGTHIGKLDGTGGVLFANGTIVNISRTVEDSNPIPVTFGDDVRIDGEIWRGLYKGTAIDNMPLKISDTMVPTMDDINDLGDTSRRWQDLYMSGTLQGNDANFGGDVNFTNATFIGDVDFTDATVTGVSGADLLTSENTWTAKNTFSDIEYSSAITRNLSISAYDFIPAAATYTYTKISGFIESIGTGSLWHRGVNLPDGAEVQSVSFNFLDDNALWMDLRLKRDTNVKSSSPDSSTEMAHILTSTDDSSWHVESDSSISDETIDNDSYNYFLELTINTSGSELRAGSVEIEYTVTTPLP